MNAETHDVHHNGDQVPTVAIDAAPLRLVALIMLGLGAAGYVILGIINAQADAVTSKRDWFSAYLVGFVFWACIPFGSLALSMLGFLTSASWNIVFRRIFQASIRTLPVVALLFVPVAASVYMGGDWSPYWWADKTWEHVPEDAPARQTESFKTGVDKELAKVTDPAKREDFRPVAEVAVFKHTRYEAVEENQHKMHDYLNPNFFLVRAVLYFLVLGAFAYFVTSWARPLEDDDSAEAFGKLRGISGPGVLVWALSGTWMVTDWVMSVEPTWASSMFPVVFGMNQFICAMAFSALVLYSITGRNTEVLAVVKDKFRIDIGSLTFAFTMLWAYATFSQYMLVWAGNLPEEIAYYKKRTYGGWEWMAYFLMLFHWLFPFVIFLFREAKTEPRTMQRLCVLLLAVCAVDAVWWIMPAYAHPHSSVHVPMALAAVLMVGGVWGVAFTYQLARRPLLPTNREGRFLAAWGHH